ncbi:MAG TPA: MFS transporter [Thermoleophilaceae bacterium]|nr:MFS transporter [Thermoleophilaceae bacterium]
MRAGRVALYAGGFLGPFGGGVVTVLIPDLRDALDTTTAGAAATLTVYLIPFALLQLVSGTIGERIGLARTVRTAYVVYALASAGVALTSTLGPFLALRGLQGAANAFTTPLLVAALADITPRPTLGRAMAAFAAVQTIGIVMAPLIGGIAGAIDYRLAFIVPAIAAVVLAMAPLPAHRRDDDTVPTLRSALTRQTRLLSAFALAAYLSTVGVGFLVALRAADSFGLSAETRGLLLAGFGFAGMLAGRPVGNLIDKRGPLTTLLIGAVASAVAIPLVGLAPSAGLLAATWALAGVASQTVWATVYTLAVDAAPANRAGAVSIVGACRFTGNALAPLVWLPLFNTHEWLPFVGAGVLLVLLSVFALRQSQAPRPGASATA